MTITSMSPAEPALASEPSVTIERASALGEWSASDAPVRMATEQLEAELVSHAAWEAAGLARMLDLLAEYDRRDGWSRWIGCLSLQQWLSWQCGLGYTAATERLRVARALQGLPEVRRRFREGALSWSKVRELTRVATARDEAIWADLAGALTAAQLSRLVRRQRRITAADVVAQEVRREATYRIADDGRMVIELSLPADEAAPAWAAIEAAAGPPQRGVSADRRRADAALGLLLGRREARTVVEVHLEECPTCQQRTAATGDGVPLHPTVADAIACDADVVTVHDHDAHDHDAHDHDARDHDDEPGARARRAAGRDVDAAEVGEIDRRRGPTRRQRRWLQRRHPTCQFPGCHHAGAFDAHHVVAHPDGGPTRVRNLARLCRAHHRLVHLLGLVLSLDADRRLVVTTPAGRPIDHPILQRALRVVGPDDPTRIGGLGERMDIDACLLAVQYGRMASSARAAA